MASRDSERRPAKATASGKPARPKKVPWARRIISSLILLALLAGIIFLVVKGAMWLGSLLNAEHEKSTEQATVKPVSITECAGGDLKISLFPSSTIVDEGVGFDLAVSIENTGSADCSVQTSEVNVTLASAGASIPADDGEASSAVDGGSTSAVWSPSTCDPQWSKTLLLKPGQSWTGDLAWNGHVYNGCDAVAEDTGGATAAAGRYSLTAQAPGQDAAQEVSIQVR